MFRAGTASPNPSPRNAVATSKSGRATDVFDSKNWLMMSSDIATRPATNPARYTCFVPKRRASDAPSSEAAIAVTTCGTKSRPYWLLERPYSSGSVKIVLAAGKVTSTMPWTAPAA